MEFRLMYQGLLKANGDKKEKHRLRKYFHPQLRKLWGQAPLKGIEVVLDPTYVTTIIKTVGNFDFACLVSTSLKLVAELDIVLLRPDVPGQLISSGDIDNRLKTLFDALRAPQNTNEIPPPKFPNRGQKPFYCLLEDDSLITSFKVTCDRLLRYRNRSEVLLLIHVKTRQIGSEKGTTWMDLMVP